MLKVGAHVAVRALACALIVRASHHSGHVQLGVAARRVDVLVSAPAINGKFGKLVDIRGKFIRN